MRACESAALLALLTFALASGTVAAREAEPARPHPKAVEFVRSKVECENPDEVVRIALAEINEDHYWDSPQRLPCDFEERDLGDGTVSYVFAPPGGAGRFARAPNFHFVKARGRLVLIYDGKDAPSEYLTGRAKVNGRYLIQRTWGDWTGPQGEEKVATTIWFWTGEAYAPAYTDEALLGPGGDVREKRPRRWVRENRGAFEDAPRSWEYLVGEGDTLYRIARRFGVTVAEIVRQNAIEDPDTIRAGMRLTYDSRRAGRRTDARREKARE